jgi:hypothetical protein
MRQRIVLVTLVSIACGTLPLSLSARGAAPRGTPSQAQTGTPPAPNPNNKVVSAPGFRLEIPKKNWDPLPVGVGSSMVVFPERSREAIVAIEIVKVAPIAVLKPEQIVEQTAKLEIEEWQARNPSASDFRHAILDTPGGKIIVLDFTQQGARGVERVRLYALPRGTHWYRVICTATQASFAKFEETFKTMAMSLTPSQ